MRPLWYMTHAVVDRMEADQEFAGFVHLSEIEYKDGDDESLLSWLKSPLEVDNGT